MTIITIQAYARDDCDIGNTRDGIIEKKGYKTSVSYYKNDRGVATTRQKVSSR